MFKLEEGWLTPFLVCALMFIAAAGVDACNWTEGLWTAYGAGLIGVLAGLVLAKSRFKGSTAALFATVYGVFCVGSLIGFLLPGSAHERSLKLIGSMGTFFLKLMLGGSSRDLLPFPTLMAGLFWAMGAGGAWMLFRRHAVWPAILPAGLTLVINVYFYRGSANLDVHVALYTLTAVLLLGHTSVLTRELEWRKSGVLFNPDIRLDFLRAGLAVALAGSAAAWITPSLHPLPQVATFWRQTNGYWTAVRETWMRMFVSMRGYGQTANDFYGDTLALGGPSRLSDSPVMDVAAGVLGGGDTTMPAKPARYYWRAAAFEQYQNGQWQLGDSDFKELGPDAKLSFTAYKMRRQVSVAFTMKVASTSRLYVVSEPMLVLLTNDIPAVYSIIAAPDNTVDIPVVRARDVLVGDERAYRVIGSISVADEASLRAAGANYPAWVTARYLQLPPEITDRTRQLARTIVDSAGARTPFDEAQAVTSWLRANIRYNPNIDAPPQGVEPVDWLLFTKREGYCNYYASAEVVMLRSLGIPARLAAGFAQGDFDPVFSSDSLAVYHVKEKDAHAWPEVFFPEFGWVEFEPTASQPPLARPALPGPQTGAAAAATPRPTPEPTEDPQHRLGRLPGATNPGSTINWGQAAQVAALVLGLAVVALAAGLSLLVRLGLVGWESLGTVGAWAVRARRQPLPSALGAIYLRLERAARWLSLNLPATLTPHERAEMLSQAVPSARPGVEAITTQYELECYSGRAADVHAAQSAWRSIRFKVWGQGLRLFARRLRSFQLVKPLSAK
jgi:transglutaminase-like putative cysteine protease